MDTTDRIHNVPVPERFLPLITRTLAEAYTAEDTAVTNGVLTPSTPTPEAGSDIKWTKEEVVRAYREATPALRAFFDHIADHSGQEVKSRDLAKVVYPNDDPDQAEGRMYGVLGGFGTKSTTRYGKKKWFFDGRRERMSDGSAGYFVYVMPDEEASWLREAADASRGADPEACNPYITERSTRTSEYTMFGYDDH
jgi:hypothetical protein